MIPQSVGHQPWQFKTLWYTPKQDKCHVPVKVNGPIPNLVNYGACECQNQLRGICLNVKPISSWLTKMAEQHGGHHVTYGTVTWPGIGMGSVYELWIRGMPSSLFPLLLINVWECISCRVNKDTLRCWCHKIPPFIPYKPNMQSHYSHSRKTLTH